ncbi:hypothetical protein BB561_003691 [Smittium simulii]|uniref:Velvet domain-containing protein n=1 Tax=Smittium simulii TaxID=133385 RepID=A0A2T9YK00_9FUNG|nr:hypothetical protein BB561_003691 [Smittium simulii]
MISSSDINPSEKVCTYYDKVFKLFIVQHPLRARMCGFGEKDKRPIDPPPVIQLKVYDTQGKSINLTHSEISSMVIYASLWSEDGLHKRDIVIDPSSIPIPNSSYYKNNTYILSLEAPKKMQNLIGTTASSSFYLLDHNENAGIFFIFNDLSVRTEGKFTLKFSFINLEGCYNNNGETSIITEVTSDIFEVYPAKKFPGMTSSTALSKAFSEQGIRIPIRIRPRVKTKTQNITVKNENDDQ